MGVFSRLFDPHYEDGVNASLKTLKEALANPIKKPSDSDIIQLRALIEKAHGGKFPDDAQDLIELLKNPAAVYAEAAKAIEAANNGWQKFVGFLGFGHINDLAEACSDLVAMQLAVKALHEEEKPLKIGEKETTNRLSDISSAVYISEHPNHAIFKDIARDNFAELLANIPAASKKAAEPVAAAPVAVKDGAGKVEEKTAPAPVKAEHKEEPKKTEPKASHADIPVPEDEKDAIAFLKQEVADLKRGFGDMAALLRRAFGQESQAAESGKAKSL